MDHDKFSSFLRAPPAPLPDRYSLMPAEDQFGRGNAGPIGALERTMRFNDLTACEKPTRQEHGMMGGLEDL